MEREKKKNKHEFEAGAEKKTGKPSIKTEGGPDAGDRRKPDEILRI